MDTHHYNVHVDQRGRLVLPVSVRRQLGIEPGSALILTVQEDGMLRLISPGEAARRGRGLLRELAPGTTRDRQLADELIAERRIEVEHE
ncbi:AbrB/MazE/SpoVT family DNA-binding domain-containing protein [Acidithiobacillus sp.]|uniref:AbrB/MazE/SpoVT family DNA-binding domain-containing protein n=1 Tax=Acidithiobacillus sp. TaxID=1872118 RepID=UPI0031FF0FAF